jgi:hypothetical protein
MKPAAPKLAGGAATSPLRGSRRRTLVALRVRLMSNRRDREAAGKQGGAMLRISAGSNMAARLRPARSNRAHETLLAGKTTAIRPQGFATTKTPEIAVRPASFQSFRRLHSRNCRTHS